MPVLSLARIVLVAAWVVLASSIASAQEELRKKPLAIEDLYQLESFRSSAPFPKEDKLVYQRTWIDAKTKSERHSLWLGANVKSKNSTPFEEGEPDGRAPVISPDGKWIAFLSARPRPAGWKQTPPAPPYSDGAVDLWLIPSTGGIAIPLGGPQKPWGRVLQDGFYGRVAFSPDSTKLLFVADDGADPRTKEEIENDVEIVRPDQGEGYTGYGPAQIWIAEIEPDPANFGAKQVTRLMNDDVWYGDPQWSPDGKTIVVHANKTRDRESVRFSINKNFDLYLIEVASKKQTQLTSNPGPDISPRFSPDGKQIAYLSSPRKGPHRDVFTLSTLTLDAGGVRMRSVFPGILPAFPLPAACWENDEKVSVTFDKGITTEAAVIDLTTGAVLREPTGHANNPLADRFDAGVEAITWKNEGFEIEGIFTTPPPEVAKPPYKVIVYPHGGPHSRSALGFDFTVQLFAARGYAVFQPNFRGTPSYGKKFLDADRFDLGGGDMRDILTGIDKLVKDSKVDPKRQFVYGISYGGFMTSWLVGQTNQFRAAVAQNAVTDMNMMWGLSDIQSWTHWELGGAPWEQPERYRKHSPLTHVAKVKTPTLILHARDDRRCPLPMGKAFYQALLANEVPTQMVIYPNEGHGIRQPRHREDVYRRVLAWFEKYDVR